MTTVESRPVAEPVEFRAESGRLVASGVAMRYGARSKPIEGRFREQFRPGAFARTIGRQDVRSHLEHQGPYLARTANGTLRLTDDRSALHYEIDLPDTTAGRDAAALLERHDVKGSSIGFRSIRSSETWTKDNDGMALRTVGEASLFYVDLTTSPAYDDSTAEMALRSFAEHTGVELRSVLEAAEAGQLAELLDQPSAGPPAEGDDGDPDPIAAAVATLIAAGFDLSALTGPAGNPLADADPPVVVRPRIGWLHA